MPPNLSDLKPFPGKSCGSCTACCTVVPVRELGLKGWHRCPHVRTPPASAVGCSIYPKRPLSCQLWSCGWLASDWPDEYRPDRCGVIVDPLEDVAWFDDKETVTIRFWVLPGCEDNWERDPAKTLIMTVVHNGFAVLWDMPPKDGVQLARGFLLDSEGIIKVTPPTAINPKAPSERDRFKRAQQLLDEAGQ